MKKLSFLSLLIYLFIFLSSFSFAKRGKTERINTLPDESAYMCTSEVELPEMKSVVTSSKVRVFLPSIGKTAQIDLEEYIVGVLSGEMNADAPSEALKAMSVAARTYTVYMMNKSKSKSYDVVADSSVSQCYLSMEEMVEAFGDIGAEKYEIMRSATQETAGEVLTYLGEPILALYHASSRDKTESCENVFIEKLEYLKSSQSFENEQNAYYKESDFSKDEFLKILNKNGYPSFDFDTLEIEIDKNENERCAFLHLYDDECSVRIEGKKVREIFSLRSTDFDVSKNESIVIFKNYGFGHGVGLSQNGANIMANRGKTYEEILRNFYKGAIISKTIYE